MLTFAELLDLSAPEKRRLGFEFTPREIAQQPDTWLGTLAMFEAQQERFRSLLESVGVMGDLQQRPVVMLVGAGTSDYIGRTLALLLKQKWGCEVTAVASTDLLTNLADHITPGRKYLWISFSRSGDSPEGVSVLEQALAGFQEISHLVVTCNAHSRMAVLAKGNATACVAILDDAVNDRSLAMTSSFTNMIVFGQCLAHAWSLAEYRKTLEGMVAAARVFLGTSAALAARVAGEKRPRLCMIGSGALAGVATESCLKVLEMSGGRIKTTAQTSLGLRHGPMAALDRETVLICFLSSEPHRLQYETDLLREIRAKNITASCIAVGLSSSREKVEAWCDTYHAIDGEFADAYRPPLDVIFGQMLGLYSSIAMGLSPDAPSPDGVISRVVSKFAIYS